MIPLYFLHFRIQQPRTPFTDYVSIVNISKVRKNKGKREKKRKNKTSLLTFLKDGLSRMIINYQVRFLVGEKFIFYLSQQSQ